MFVDNGGLRLYCNLFLGFMNLKSWCFVLKFWKFKWRTLYEQKFNSCNSVFASSNSLHSSLLECPHKAPFPFPFYSKNEETTSCSYLSTIEQEVHTWKGCDYSCFELLSVEGKKIQLNMNKARRQGMIGIWLNHYILATCLS